MGNDKTKAFIFDMDGVIVDTTEIIASIESNLFRGYGIHLTPEEIIHKYSGATSKEMIPDVFRSFNKQLPNLDEIIKERAARVDATLHGNVRAIPGTLDFINFLKSEGFPIGIASGSRGSFIRLVLDELSIYDKFDAITSAEEVKRGKPEPDMFLLTAKKMNANPQSCIVIEDGIRGMLAAKSAGMKCVGLIRKGELDKRVYPADILVRNLKELDLKDV